MSEETIAPPRVRRAAEAKLPTEYGEFRLFGYVSEATGEEYAALVHGTIDPASSTLVRIHSQCLTGDVFHSIRCDCRKQIEAALLTIAQNGSGVLLYQVQEGRGIGLINKIRAYGLQDRGADTVEANLLLGLDVDARDYSECAEILKDMGVQRARMMSNNPDKLAALEQAGIVVEERVALDLTLSDAAARYVQTKRDKLGHLIED